MAEKPLITISHRPQAGALALPSHDDHLTDHLLRRVGFLPVPDSHLYALSSPEQDPVRRTRLAVQSLRAAHQTVATDTAYDLHPGEPSTRSASSSPDPAVLGQELDPDDAFGTIPDLGIAAAVADGRPAFLEEVLRQHHFEHDARLDVYLPPPETPHHTAVQAMAAATRQVQEAGFTVAADPGAVVPPHGDDPGPALRRKSAAPEESASAPHEAAEAVEAIRSALDEGLHPVEELEYLIGTTVSWCDRLDSSREGRDVAEHMNHIKYLVTALNDHLMSTLMDLEDIRHGVSPHIPAHAQVLDRERRERSEQRVGPVESPVSRAQAATASSPHRADPTPQSALAHSPAAAPPSPGHRHTR